MTPPSSLKSAAPADARPRAAPPPRHPWQLAISTVLLALWILFLAAMALAG
jgi:hypothetical protein